MTKRTLPRWVNSVKYLYKQLITCHLLPLHNLLELIEKTKAGYLEQFPGEAHLGISQTWHVGLS